MSIKLLLKKLKKNLKNYKKTIKKILKDINALCNASEARLAEIEAKLPPKYVRDNMTKRFIDGIPLATYSGAKMVTSQAASAVLASTQAGTKVAMVAGVVAHPLVAGGVGIATGYVVGTKIKELVRKQNLKYNFQQVKDNMSVFSEDTKPAPEFNPLEKPNVHEAIAKIETPLQRLNSILPELTADNITSVSDETLARFFDTSAIMAAYDEFDINERFKPLLKSLEIMPNEKFECNSVINNYRVFSVTNLIKSAIILGRGDIATELMTHSMPKINAHNPELMQGIGTIANDFRQELSEITELSQILNNKDHDLTVTDNDKPLNKMWNLARTGIIPEYVSDDPTEPMDIPVTGHLPEMVASAISDLRNHELRKIKKLVEYAHDDAPHALVTGNDIFNGQDKKILSLMIATLQRSINPNPLNEIMSDFLTLYTAGHFAECGGFSDTANDDYSQPLRVLDRLVNVVNSQTQYNNEPTILERIENKLRQQDQIIGDNRYDNRCDFKKAYRTSDGMVNVMKIRFNQYPPKIFKTSITPNMAKHRIFGG
jgi:hypothetical protein